MLGRLRFCALAAAAPQCHLVRRVRQVTASMCASAASIRRRRRAIATVTPYAGEPQDLRPYAKFAAPYDENYTHPNIYTGAAATFPSPRT
jgi:hypothetical protein